MRDELLAALAQYGSPALFLAVTIAAVGVPLPITLLLVVTGSLVSQRVMNLWWAIGLASAGSIIGDQIGYAIGRFGGTALVQRLERIFGSSGQAEKAEAHVRRWGGMGVFLTRWLATPLGPWMNVASGISCYSWPKFLFWDITGEVLCAALFILLGRAFSDRVMAMSDLLGDLTWSVVALWITGVLGWRLMGRMSVRRRPPATARTSVE